MRAAQLSCWRVGVAYLALQGLLGATLLEAARPEESLQQRYGLKRLSSTNIWAVPVEHDLRALWDELPQHRDAVIVLEQALTERVQRNARQWAVADRTEARLRASISALQASDRDRARLEQQLARLRVGLSPPQSLGDHEAVRAQLIELAERRNAICFSARAIRHKTRQLAEAYAPLDNGQVTKLLRKVGPNHRLGPARNYVDDLKKLAEFERAYLTAWVPLFCVGERQRLTLIANESTPITFTWTSSPEPALITAAMAEAIGVEPRADAKEQVVSIERQMFRARPAVVPYLQCGKHQVRDVEVLVLPPEAESVGARIGPAALKGFRAEAQPERLRLVLTPLASIGPTE